MTFILLYSFVLKKKNTHINFANKKKTWKRKKSVLMKTKLVYSVKFVFSKGAALIMQRMPTPAHVVVLSHSSLLATYAPWC